MVTVSISKEEVQDAIRAAYVEARTVGKGWWYVRAHPDGHLNWGCEPSPCMPEAEYFGRGNPHPMTLWSLQVNGRRSPRDGEFEWEPCGPFDTPEFYADRSGTVCSPEPDDDCDVPCRLSDQLLEDLDWDDIMPDVEERLGRAGYTLVD